MMNQIYFVEAKKIFAEAGIEIVASEFHSSSFGSCFIEVGAKPNCRFVYDGKDGIYVVETKGDEIFNGLPVWKTIWSGKKENEEQWKDAINKTIEVCKQSA